MELKNFTPHPIALHGPEGIVNLPVAGPAPRLDVFRVSLGTMAGLPLVRSTMGNVQGLPAQEAGVVLVVSALVAEAASKRTDLAYPGEAIRDAEGRIVGARGLCAGPGLAQLTAINARLAELENGAAATVADGLARLALYGEVSP